MWTKFTYLLALLVSVHLVTHSWVKDDISAVKMQIETAFKEKA